VTESGRLAVGDVASRVLEGLRSRAATTVPLGAAGGLVLAEDVVLPAPLPPEPRAAMDGVAVRAEDVAGATPAAPTRLRVDGASLAGHGDRRPLPVGVARQIATGAPLPEGADAVVRVEALEQEPDGVLVTSPVPAGHDVRPAGEDGAAGTVLVAGGRVLDAGAIGGVAGAGVTTVRAVPRPRVAVLPTGDEVVAGTTPDAVGPMLRHLLSSDGAHVHTAPPVRDDLAAIREAVETLAVQHDLVVTVGGVSVGPRDHAAELVASLACGEAVSLALRPGRPFAWGRTRDDVTVLCLPGTPLASLTAAVLLARPVVARLAGRPPPVPAAVQLGVPLSGDTARRCLVPATVHDGHAHPVAGNGAADLVRLATTTVLVDLPAGAERREAGEVVDAWPLP
jgi:molybdopterin molybdotransferase